MRPCALLRHFGMNDAARRRHPLHIARTKVTAVTEVIFVAHVAIEHVRDGLEAAMRMGGKTGDVIVWVIRIELI